MPYQDWRHNHWVQNMANTLNEKTRKSEMEAVDRLMGRLPSFVYHLNEKIEALELPEDAVVVGDDGEKVIDAEKAKEAIERFPSSSSCGPFLLIFTNFPPLPSHKQTYQQPLSNRTCRVRIYAHQA